MPTLASGDVSGQDKANIHFPTVGKSHVPQAHCHLISEQARHAASKDHEQRTSGGREDNQISRNSLGVKKKRTSNFSVTAPRSRLG